MKRTIYAYDFDGVICNSAVETAMTAWKAAQTLWSDIAEKEVLPLHIEQFIQVRPQLEFGYESILIMRLFHLGKTVEQLITQYKELVPGLIQSEKLNEKQLQILFGQTRDHWITDHEENWLDNNPLYKGIGERLKRIALNDFYIVTTKQERFVKRILKANGLAVDEDKIYGLDKQLTKQQVLKIIIDKEGVNDNKTDGDKTEIVFIEDRLPALLGVLNNPALGRVQCQLVDWGYNTEEDRALARERNIEVLSLGG